MATIAEFLASVGFQADEKSLSTALAKVAGFGAAVSATAGLAIAGIMHIAESQVSLAKSAEKLGVSIQKMEELNYIAEQTGASTDAMAASLGALKDKYPHIKDASTLLERVGQRMAGMNEQSRKLYAQRMGIDPQLIPMLTQDVAALKGEFAAMYAVAGTDAKKAAQDSKAFLAEIGKLKTISTMLSKAVGLAFIGEIRRDVENLRRIIMENFDKIRRIFETIIGVVLRAAGVIGAFVTRVVLWASSLVSWYDKLDEGQKKLVLGAAALLAAWKLLNMGFLATPIGVLVAGLAAIIALVDDYQTYMEGGESYFDWGPWAESIENVRAAIGQALAAVGQFVSDNQRLFTAIAKGVGVALLLKGALLGVTGIIGGVAGAVKVLWGLLRANPVGLIITAAALIIEYWEPIKEFFATLWDGFAESFPNFAAWAESAATAITDFIAPAVDWIKGKLDSLLGLLPKALRGKLGLGGEQGGGKGDGSPPSPPINAVPPTGPLLTPSPARAAQIDNSRAQSVTIDAKTEIHVNGAQDPAATGRHVAGEQNRVNADMVRHTKGAAR